MDVSAQNNTKNATSNQSGPSSSAKAPRPDSLGFGIDPQQLPEKVAEKIQRGANILIALSKDPNLDEMSAAIALAIVLDQQKKHVTAIYSGKTPNALEFLKPEETFEKDTSSLQDFIIALNKSKADHLTYKLDGDYVKIYITPYKGQVKKEDLEYSYGDYNVDLVIVFNVNAGTEIDSALSEYGRIMHDASAINITSGLPGRFADLEWSDPEKSSVCEMVYDLLKELEITELSQEVATALLTGILSATERFSNNRTKPTTMAVASKLMEAGADQQLISANILKPETPAASENLAPSDTSATSEAPTSSDVPTIPEAPTSSDTPAASEIPVSSDTPTTAGVPATVDTPTVSDPNNSNTGLKELEELVNQNLAAQTTNLQNNQEASSEASQLPNLPGEEPSLSATPLTTGNVMDELARMTASMTNTDQEANNLTSAPDLQAQITPQTQATPQAQVTSQTQATPEIQVAPQAQATPQTQPAPEIQSTPQVQPFSQVQPEVQPQTYENPQVSMQFQPQAQPQAQIQPQAQAQFETQVQAQPQPQPQPQSSPQFQPQQYAQPLPPAQPVSAPSMQSQLPPVNPLPFQSSPDIVGHTISDPVIESGEDMSRLMDEVLAEPSPIQNPVGYQSLINQGDYINQSLSQQPAPNPQPTPVHPLSVGQQPIVNYIPGQNIATLSAPAMPTMPQNTNYPNPEYTNTIPEYSTPAIPTMPAAPTSEPQPVPNLQPTPEPHPASNLQSSLNPQPSSTPQPAPTTPVDPMADFIQATPPATSTPIPDFLRPEAFLPPAPAPVVPAQPTPVQNGYSMQPTVPNMPLPPVAPNGLPTPPIIEPTPEATPTPQIPQAPTIQSTPAPTPQTSPAPQVSTTPVDPSAFRIPGTY